MVGLIYDGKFYVPMPILRPLIDKALYARKIRAGLPVNVHGAEGFRMFPGAPFEHRKWRHYLMRKLIPGKRH